METSHYLFQRVTSRQEQNPLDLSMVMPVFNEGDIVEAVLKDWDKHLTEMGLSYELIVINDGSLDGTGRVLDKLRREMGQLRIIHQLNTGHGQAVRRGYSMARGEYILQCDLNGRYEPDDFTQLWELRGSQRMILGHRTHRLDSFPRRCLSSLLKRLSFWITGVELQDPNVPFRLFKREPLMKFLRILPEGWRSTNLALSIYVSRETPQLISEVKIPFRQRTLGPSSTTLYDLWNLGFEYLGELFALRKLLKSAPDRIALLKPLRAQ
jgi:dolichol-phosphate mannosyltransferase